MLHLILRSNLRWRSATSTTRSSPPPPPPILPLFLLCLHFLNLQMLLDSSPNSPPLLSLCAPSTRLTTTIPPGKAPVAKLAREGFSEQSSWEAKDSEGRDYLYRLGKEADNMNIAVGARAGIIDDLFVGNFLGRDCNFLFRIGGYCVRLRQKVTRSFEYLQGDYYIAPVFMASYMLTVVTYFC
ncbi:hypothetical protein CK203_084410 [Vitis vinifera]|uniref:Uncharacterized protein n=1 Tax=Vitis vinifera TaxID=29760 RepID=A0A438EN75_VITVI|nr:hypothetical protein CK203_084410 [Vitis vinifera]